MVPKHWPKGFVYARTSTSPDLGIDFLRVLLSTGNPEDLNKISSNIEAKQIFPHLKMMPITKKHFPNHPLSNVKTLRGHTERGVFATKAIPAGTELGECVGEMYLIDKEGCFPTDFIEKAFSEYTWRANIRNFRFFVNPKKIANELAFVNDYRGLAPASNVKPQWIIHRGSFYFCLISIDEIQNGEELLLDYGKAYWIAMQKRAAVIGSSREQIPNW